MIVIPKETVLDTLKSLTSKQLKVVERAIHRSLVMKEPLPVSLAREEFTAGDKVTFIYKGAIKVGVLKRMNTIYARIWVAKDEIDYSILPKNIKLVGRKTKESIN